MMGKLLQVVARHAFKGVLLGSPNGAALGTGIDLAGQEAPRVIASVPGLFLYYPSRRQTQPALRAFIDCLLDQK